MLKPSPTNVPVRSSQRRGCRPLSIARPVAQTARRLVSASRLSMVLLRLVTTLIGLTARANAAMIPASAPQARRTR